MRPLDWFLLGALAAWWALFFIELVRDAVRLYAEARRPQPALTKATVERLKLTGAVECGCAACIEERLRRRIGGRR